METIMFLVVLASAIWAAIDASRIQMYKYKTFLGGSVGVFLGCALLWIVCFPLYLVTRSKIVGGRAELKDQYKKSAQTQTGATQTASTSPGTNPPPAMLNTDKMEQLKRLAELKESKVLTEEEFVHEKSKILG